MARYHHVFECAGKRMGDALVFFSFWGRIGSDMRMNGKEARTTWNR